MPLRDSPNLLAAAAFLLNLFANYITDKSFFGLSNREVSAKYPTIITPAGYAFAIWGVIFSSEFAMLTFIFFSSMFGTHSRFNDVTWPFTCMLIFQSIWCVTFSKEMLVVSIFQLAGINLSLWYSYNAVIASKDIVGDFAFSLMYFPISMHYNWTFAATILNINLAFVSMDFPPSYDVFLSLLSLWLVTLVSVYRGIRYGDIMCLLVGAWTLNAIASKLSISPPLKQSRTDRQINTLGNIIQSCRFAVVIIFLVIAGIGLLHVFNYRPYKVLPISKIDVNTAVILAYFTIQCALIHRWVLS